MAVIITTKPGTTGAQLLTSIQAEITKKAIATWLFNAATGFEHTAASGTWNTGGYLEVQPSTNAQQLILYAKTTPGSTVPKAWYGVLNGRFSEMLFNHFGGVIDNMVLKRIP